MSITGSINTYNIFRSINLFKLDSVLVKGINDTDINNTANKNVDNADVAALNLKFRCIMQLLIEGLKALPSKCTLEKLKLRKTLKSMVQRELEYLHSICDYDNQDNGGIYGNKSRGHSLTGSEWSSSADKDSGLLSSIHLAFIFHEQNLVLFLFISIVLLNPSFSLLSRCILYINVVHINLAFYLGLFSIFSVLLW